MKKTTAVIFLLIIATAMPAQKKATYIIDGQISGIKDSSVIALFKNKGKILATDTIMDGKFILVFANNTGETMPVKLLLHKGEYPVCSREIWIAPDVRTHITGNEYETSIWNVGNNIPQQIELNRYIAEGHEQIKQLQYLADNIIKTDYQMRGRKLPVHKIEEMQNKIELLNDSAMILTDSLFQKELPIMRESKNNDILLAKMAEYASLFRDRGRYIPLAQIRDIFNTLPPEEKNSALGKKIQLSLSCVSASHSVTSPSNKPETEKQLTDINGDKHTLSQYKGKFVLVDFWASWCQPCVQSLTEVKEINDNYKDKITVIGINLDEHESDWKGSSKTHNITWLNLHEEEGFRKGLHKYYRGKSIPYYVVISPEGETVSMWEGYRPGELKKRIKNHIKQTITDN